jgi:predicted RNA-binding Zn ribbon-like protein
MSIVGGRAAILQPHSEARIRMVVKDSGSARRFSAASFVSGAACLDFVNTVGGTRDGECEDFLSSYEALIGWLDQSGLISSERAAAFRKRAAASPDRAAAALRRARALRETLYAVLEAAGSGEPPEQAEMDSFNRAWAKARSRQKLVRGKSGFAAGFDYDGAGLDAVLWPIALSAGDLLLSERFRLIRECVSETCGWLFLDTSKNRSRRWCDMRVCGNRAKQRRHRASAQAS